MTDEETLERAFLSALQKHFKKPGPWRIETFPTTRTLEAEIDKVYEVFILLSNGGQILMNDMPINTMVGVSIFANTWIPHTLALALDSFDTQASLHLLSDSGYILSGDRKFTTSTDTKVLIRRRFDLET